MGTNSGSRVLAAAAGALAVVLAGACSGGGCHTSVSKSWDASYSVSYGGGTAVDASVAPSASAAAPASSTSTADAAASATTLHGTFHLDGVDETNLVIADDGTFFWEVNGCDFHGGDCGVRKKSGTTLVLTPKSPDTKMSWSTPTANGPRVTRVVVSEHGGNLEAHGTDEAGKTFVQLWYPGEVCAPCSGRLGPSGPLAACTKPLETPCP